MNDILGLLMLVMPLPVFVLIGIGFIVIVLLTSRRKGGEGRIWKLGLLVGAAFLLIFTWDVILGRAYFFYLCATEGGIKVYKQITLPPEFRFATLPTSETEFNNSLLSEHIVPSRNWKEDLPGPARISFNQDILSDRLSGDVLATHTHLIYRGGWLANSTWLHIKGHGCHGYSKAKDYRAFVAQAFRDVTNESNGSIKE